MGPSLSGGLGEVFRVRVGVCVWVRACVCVCVCVFAYALKKEYACGRVWLWMCVRVLTKLINITETCD